MSKNKTHTYQKRFTLEEFQEARRMAEIRGFVSKAGRVVLSEYLDSLLAEDALKYLKNPDNGKPQTEEK